MMHGRSASALLGGQVSISIVKLTVYGIGVVRDNQAGKTPRQTSPPSLTVT
jgi:hypothetical protein